MSVKKLMPRIIEDIDPPFGPVAVMKYDNDGLYVPASDYAALLARHNALVESVRWERECIRQLDYAGRFWEDDNIPGRELIKFLDAARAEVDRLIANETTADCKGEG